MFKFMRQAVFILFLASASLFLLLLSGCVDDYDRYGSDYSHLPQNRPSEWEMRPYGDFRN